MDTQKFHIDGPLLLTPKRFGDERGFFSETYRQSWLDELGIPIQFIQENHARSSAPSIIRGLHFQTGKSAQTKLIRATKGAILDVIVDIRASSPTYGQHIAVELSEDNFSQLLVPKGFAHGYCTLTPEVEVLYKVDAYYAPEAEGALHWNDPDLAINWPVRESEALLSEKDKAAQSFCQFKSPFSFDEEQKPFQVICDEVVV